jgi:hypothetical protein
MAAVKAVNPKTRQRALRHRPMDLALACDLICERVPSTNSPFTNKRPASYNLIFLLPQGLWIGFILFIGCLAEERQFGFVH